MHLQKKLRILPLYGFNQSLHDNPRFQFLPNFTLQRILRRLPRFHFTPWELPTILKIPIPSLRGEDTTLIIVYNGCYYFYLFHLSN